MATIALQATAITAIAAVFVIGLLQPQTVTLIDFRTGTETYPNPVGFALFCLCQLVANVADTIFIALAWKALPQSRRPFGLHPALCATLSYIPLLGFAWYWVAYGWLGAEWAALLRTHPATADEKRDISAVGYLGYVIAGVLCFIWIMNYAGAFVDATGGDFSWWHLPLSGGQHRARGLAALLKIFSLDSISKFVIAGCMYVMYFTIITHASKNHQPCRPS